MFHCNIERSTCTKGNSKTDKTSLAVRTATSLRRSVSHVVRLWSVRKHNMFGVCYHSSGRRRGRGGGTSGEFPKKVAQQVKSHSQATMKQFMFLQQLLINRVQTM